MPKLTPAQRRLKNALERGVCYKSVDFDYLCSRAPYREAVIIEGDSWVDYPRKYIITGPSINLGHRFEQTTEYLDTVNVLRIGRNGDTAVGMTKGKQIELMKKILKKNGRHVSLMLFSAGGNDIVGESDLDPMIKKYDPASHHEWEDVVEMDLFDGKLEQILEAYLRMIELYKLLAPDAVIVTHTYDCVNPSPQGAAFFWNLIKTKSWVWPTMQKRNIPVEWRAPIIQYMLKLFSLRIQALQNHPSAIGRFYVVDTQGTLDPTSKADWLNEIHATPSGYRKIFDKMYPTLKQLLPVLP